MADIRALVGARGVGPDSVCIVGGLALRLLGVREHRDVDIVATSFARAALLGTAATSRFRRRVPLADRVTLHVGWGDAIGLADDELVESPRNHRVIDGLKVVRPELLMAVKASTGRPHDLDDLLMLAEFAGRTDSWDWALVRDVSARRSLLQRVIETFAAHGAAGFATFAARRFFRRIRARRDAMAARLRAGRVVRTLATDGALHYPVANLLLRQYHCAYFSRLDVVVRVLAVEQLRGLNSVGLGLYERMQAARGAVPGSRGRLETLVASVDRVGMKDSHPIMIDPDGRLVDGSHRVALALLRDERRIAVSISPRSFTTDYGRAWFARRGFTADEIALVEARLDELLQRRGVFFQAVIWPPAFGQAAAVERAIAARFRIVASREVDLGAGIHDFVRAVYAIDDIDRWKVERKVANIAGSGSRVRLITIEVPAPTFRAKRQGGSTAREIERLNSDVRRALRPLVSNDINDVIIHIGDNPAHNRAMYELTRGI